MQIVTKPIAEIKPYDNNPRDNEKAVKPVAESIQQFGFKVPIIIDKDGVIVTGHTRYKAAQLLGLTEVPTISADDLNEEQIKAFRIADNKVSEFATWDFEKLQAELEGIQELDMSAYGFDIEVDGEPNVEEDDFDPDDLDEEEPKTAHGDIYKLGDHYLMCGDSTSPEDIKKLTGGATDRPARHRPALQRSARNGIGRGNEKKEKKN